jgi:hypothetical protein
MKTAHVHRVCEHAGRVYVYDVSPGCSGGECFEKRQTYEVCVGYEELGDGVVLLAGLDRPITPEHWRAIRQALRAAGYRQARFERAAGSRMGIHQAT